MHRVRDSPPERSSILDNPSARRARECLLFLAGRPGSSNREIATGIGITYPSQMSRLLARLASEELVSKHSEGVGRRNMWWLTSRGEQVSRTLLEVDDRYALANLSVNS